MTTGERIKKLRLEKNMSQEELGEKVGVQKAAINKYETGIVVNLKRGMIAKLADALDVSPSYLMGWDDDDEQTFWKNVVDPDRDDTLRMAEELRNRPGMRMLFDAAKNCTEEDLLDVAALVGKFRRKGEDD